MLKWQIRLEEAEAYNIKNIRKHIMIRIKHILGREILDSRGIPTTEVEITLSNSRGVEIVERSAAPSGASTGIYEAIELRDGESRYYGKGVRQALNNIERVIAPALLNKEFANPVEIDELLIELDASENKQVLGANALLPVSLAVAKAAAAQEKLPLFAAISKWYGYEDRKKLSGCATPMFNVINGGKHADNLLDLQEFMIVPTGGTTFAEKLRMGSEIFRQLAAILKKRGLATNVGDEGGFAPNLSHSCEALDLISLAINVSGYENQVRIALDAAASTFYQDGKYILSGEGKGLDGEGMSAYYQKLVDNYDIISIEDPMAEDDVGGWIDFTNQIEAYAAKREIRIVGDDIFVTNELRLRDGIALGIANSILIKPNQVGTLKETMATILAAQQHGYTPIISHRSGETECTAIVHIAVASQIPYVKCGSVCRGERINKYNELLRIYESMKR